MTLCEAGVLCHLTGVLCHFTHLTASGWIEGIPLQSNGDYRCRNAHLSCSISTKECCIISDNPVNFLQAEGMPHSLALLFSLQASHMSLVISDYRFTSHLYNERGDILYLYSYSKYNFTTFTTLQYHFCRHFL